MEPLSTTPPEKMTSEERSHEVRKILATVQRDLELENQWNAKGIQLVHQAALECVGDDPRLCATLHGVLLHCTAADRGRELIHHSVTESVMRLQAVYENKQMIHETDAPKDLNAASPHGKTALEQLEMLEGQLKRIGKWNLPGVASLHKAVIEAHNGDNMILKDILWATLVNCLKFEALQIQYEVTGNLALHFERLYDEREAEQNNSEGEEYKA